MKALSIYPSIYVSIYIMSDFTAASEHEIHLNVKLLMDILDIGCVNLCVEINASFCFKSTIGILF